MRRRAFVDGFVLIVLAAAALGFLFYFAMRAAPAPAKAAPAKVVKPADQPEARPAAKPPQANR